MPGRAVALPLLLILYTTIWIRDVEDSVRVFALFMLPNPALLLFFFSKQRVKDCMGVRDHRTG